MKSLPKLYTFLVLQFRFYLFLKYLKQEMLIVFLVASIFSAKGQGKLAKEIKDHKNGMKIWWAGHSSWLIKSGDLLVATDLWLEDKPRFEPAPIAPEELSDLDVSFVTHAHDDHFNKYTSQLLVEKSKCIFVIPESCLSKALELKIPKERIRIAKPREPFTFLGIQVNPIRAIHGNANFAIYYDANLQDCGYYFTIDSVSFLQPGDSYLLEDHLFLKKVNVLFFSPTEHNMYIDRSVILINTLNPDYILPQHHGTIKFNEEDRFWAKGYPAEVKLRLSQPLKDKYFILDPGDHIQIKK